MGRVIPVLVGLFALGIGIAIWLHFQKAPAAPPPVDSRSQATSQPAPDAPGSPGFDTARAALERLPVKGWDRNTDFVRYRFGEAWSDDVNVEFGHNGCNTRDDILRRDLADLVVRPGTCYAQTGVLHDPYTRRRDFANDPRNLLAVGAQANFARLFATPPRGCRPTRRSVASSLCGRST